MNLPPPVILSVGGLASTGIISVASIRVERVRLIKGMVLPAPILKRIQAHIEQYF
jgi:hypothetical protein